MSLPKGPALRAAAAGHYCQHCQAAQIAAGVHRPPFRIVRGMDVEPLPEFLKPLEYLKQPFPREAVEIAVERREEAIPYLLRSLEWANANPAEANDGDRPYMLHVFGLYLLAQFRETRALPLVIQLFHNPRYEELTGAIATEGLSQILASVSGGDAGPIQAVIEDASFDQWVRSAAVNALGVLVHSGLRSRQEISAYLGELLSGRLERKPSHVWDIVCAVCSDFGFAEHLPAIRQAFAEKLVNPRFDPLEDLEQEIQLPPGTSHRVSWKRYGLVSDTIEAINWWDCFRTEAEVRAEKARRLQQIAAGGQTSGLLPDEFKPVGAAATPLVRSAPKVGRNDPCPCNSGKKYKKCCGSQA